MGVAIGVAMFGGVENRVNARHLAEPRRREPNPDARRSCLHVRYRNLIARVFKTRSARPRSPRAGPRVRHAAAPLEGLAGTRAGRSGRLRRPPPPPARPSPRRARRDPATRFDFDEVRRGGARRPEHAHARAPSKGTPLQRAPARGRRGADWRRARAAGGAAAAAAGCFERHVRSARTSSSPRARPRRCCPRSRRAGRCSPPPRRRPRSAAPRRPVSAALTAGGGAGKLVLF
jgi:hypothetical protein